MQAVQGVIENKKPSDIEIAVNRFLLKCSIICNVYYQGAHSTHNGRDWEHDKWTITLARTNEKKRASFEYHTGIGHRTKKKNGWSNPTIYAVKPAPAGLIYSCIMSGNACNQSFADWCSDFGYDTDSRKALATYEACQQEYNKLQSIFTSAEIEQLGILLEEY